MVNELEDEAAAQYPSGYFGLEYPWMGDPVEVAREAYMEGVIAERERDTVLGSDPLPPSISAPGGMRWVTCAAELSWDVARYRHLLDGPYADTTKCGATASERAVWRGNRSKPDCPRCADHAAKMCGDYPAPCNCDDPRIHNGH